MAGMSVRRSRRSRTNPPLLKWQGLRQKSRSIRTLRTTYGRNYYGVRIHRKWPETHASGWLVSFSTRGMAPKRGMRAPDWDFVDELHLPGIGLDEAVPLALDWARKKILSPMEMLGEVAEDNPRLAWKRNKWRSRWEVQHSGQPFFLKTEKRHGRYHYALTTVTRQGMKAVGETSVTLSKHSKDNARDWAERLILSPMEKLGAVADDNPRKGAWLLPWEPVAFEDAWGAATGWEAHIPNRGYYFVAETPEERFSGEQYAGFTLFHPTRYGPRADPHSAVDSVSIGQFKGGTAGRKAAERHFRKTFPPGALNEAWWEPVPPKGRLLQWVPPYDSDLNQRGGYYTWHAKAPVGVYVVDGEGALAYQADTRSRFQELGEFGSTTRAARAAEEDFARRWPMVALGRAEDNPKRGHKGRERKKRKPRKKPEIRFLQGGDVKHRRASKKLFKTGQLVLKRPNMPPTVFSDRRILGTKRDELRAREKQEDGLRHWWEVEEDLYRYYEYRNTFSDWDDDVWDDAYPCECSDVRGCFCKEPSAMIALAKLYFDAPLSWTLEELQASL